MLGRTLIGLSAAVMLAIPAYGAAVASDNASDPAYDGAGWNGNGGTGFSAWTFADNGDGSQSGRFIGSSTTNGSNPSPGIDTAGESFGLYANSGESSTASRSFIGSLAVGQTFSFDFDNGFIDNGGQTYVSLRSGGTERFRFGFTGGESAYKIDGDSEVDTGIGFTDDGFNVGVTITGTGDTYSVVIDGGTAITGTFNGTGAIDGFTVGNDNAGSFDARNFFTNSFEVTPIPEPLSVLAGGGLLGLIALGGVEGRPTI